MHKCLLDFPSRQSLSVSFVICTNLVHLDCQMPSASLSNKLTIHHLCPQFVVMSLSASSYSSKSKLIFSTCFLTFLPIFHLSILATIFAVCVTKLNVQLSLHFVPFFSFYNTITVTLCYCLFHMCCWSVLSLFWDLFLRYTLQNIRTIVVCIYLVFRFKFWFSLPLD